jgi:hypothetical protein
MAEGNRGSITWPLGRYVAEYPIEGGKRCLVQSVGMSGKVVGDHDHFVVQLCRVAG